MLAKIEDLSPAARKKVGAWLWLGVILVLGQIIIGGITRLTNSGLSITEWNIIAGSIPPMNQAEWDFAFQQYQTFAAKQYNSLHADMTLEAFKKIFFWEFLHRLWARTMGFVFIFPFLFFYFKKWMSKDLFKQLLIVILLASLAAIFGWIMVKSGLNNDRRTWVSAYKLVIHLLLGTSLFSYLLWTALHVSLPYKPIIDQPSIRQYLWFVIVLLFIQIMFGGLMAGMRAGLIFPQISILSDPSTFKQLLAGDLTMNSIQAYESDVKIKAIVQILHRIMAYLVAIFIFSYYFKGKKIEGLQNSSRLLLIVLLLQISFGLITITQCIGSVPVFWGAVHQTTAFILVGMALYNLFLVRK